MITSMSVEQSPHIDDLEEAVLARKLALLFAALKPSLIVTLVNAAIIIWVLWPVVESQYLVSWFCLVTLVTFGRASLLWQYQRQHESQRQVATWYRYFYIGSTLSAIVWGGSAFIIFPENDLLRQVFLAFVVGGMAAGAIGSLSYVRQVILSYILLSVLPFALHFIFDESDIGYAMGGMMLIYMAMLVISANRSSESYDENIRLRRSHSEKVRQIKENEDQYQTLLDTIADAFFLYDNDGKFRNVNRQACRSLGYTHEELLNMSVADIEKGLSKAEIAEVFARLDKGEYVRLEGVHQRQDGSTFPVEITTARVNFDDSPVNTAIVRDITERHRVDKLKNEFISTVSHELRTPLTSIRGSLGLLQGGAVEELSDKVQQIVDIAYNNTERLLLIINDILDIQKLESNAYQLNIEYFILSDFLEESVKENMAYAEQFEIQLTLDVEPDIKLSADKARMKQVLANLISNAVKFSEVGKHVDIRASQTDDATQITIQDYGAGIPDAFIPKLFDRFSQSDASDSRAVGGTGLGLSIVKLLVEKQGGTIEVASIEGEGSTFILRFPHQ